MTTHTFRVRPGITPAGDAPTNPLTNVRPVMDPVGRPKVILDALTGTYSHYERARIAQTWFDLLDAGLLAKLDQLHMYGRTLNDIMLPWVESKPLATNHGGAWVDGLGISLVGTESDYIDTGLNPTTDTSLYFTLNSASLGVDLTVQPVGGADYIVGCNQSAGPLKLQKSNTGLNMVLQLNTTDTTTEVGGGMATGLWMGNRPSATTQQLLLDGVLVEEETANASTAVTTGNILIGRTSSSTYGTFTMAGWFFGAGLTTQELSDLSAIMKRLYDKLT